MASVPSPQNAQQTGPKTGTNTHLSGLLAPLQRLDQRLQQTIEQAFGLSAFDVGVIVMAIAPELDRRYERLYASLQLLHWSHSCRPEGEISAKSLRKPNVDLALNLLCSGSHSQLAQQSRFAPGSPLMRLLQSINPDLQTLDQQILQLNPAVSQYLLGQRSLDASISPFCEISWNPAQRKSSGSKSSVEAIAAAANAPLLLLGAMARPLLRSIANPIQYPSLGLMEIASQEIEAFRQRLMQSSSEPS